MLGKPTVESVNAADCIQTHFGKVCLQDVVTANRTFPITSRVDLQNGLEKLFGSKYKARLVGIHSEYSHETLTFGHVLRKGNYPVVISPLQYEEIEVGEIAPARCVRLGIWLSTCEKIPFAVLVAPAGRFGMGEGVHLEIAIPPGEKGMNLSRDFLDELTTLIARSSTYRGKALSFEVGGNFTGAVSGVKVHKLQPVPREAVILPEKTLLLLERNVHDFIRQRDKLLSLGMAAKKGLLFYGPPGTGKTHTIRYLASQLPDHTTFLITAEQMGLLDQYFRLARYLQPAVVVIEDVDLIARSRTQLRNSCEESLLNHLLNEMDGLREDAAVIFILTTNAPESLEAALASRPGRIDQAIEFPLPDDDGRRKLVRLYARNLELSDEVVELIVAKTSQATGAFIKELMRRAAQVQLQKGDGGVLRLDHINTALDEMLFAGGALNLKLLGGRVAS